ncbi:hypothetical protein T4B_8528 [Trichinella pseudospiralis]|uniref:Uncharacterized protein n=2 Tax=Trichinella pseudospiralis TaxID=6337 RepID=A0A0V1EH15_TRIPS|nr:hypothetical protein T4A_8293 [Trichinella pseudospiralis]KRY80953.1 hypothetical protein T4D_13665 [Trichinella pseudospiralis]KRZ22971.1 hypothetical protein T4B_8528 [Trichinella pseudospiralis]
MVVRVIHLEPLPDLMTNSFLHALRRFVTRRRSADIIQPNRFRNFHQLNRFLQHLFSERNYRTVSGIRTC